MFFFCLETLRQVRAAPETKIHEQTIPPAFQTVYKDSIISIKIEMQNLSVFSFVLIQKKQKIKKRSSAYAQANAAPATFSGSRANPIKIFQSEVLVYEMQDELKISW